jgi:hypothetical protein
MKMQELEGLTASSEIFKVFDGLIKMTSAVSKMAASRLKATIKGIPICKPFAPTALCQ